MKQIIEDFIPMGGRHCITNSLKQIFYYYGHPISEAMIFGIASGISFAYINLADSPMVSGRTKPFVFEEKLAEQLGIKIKCRKPKDYVNAVKKMKCMLDDKNPVLIYADMPYMSYLNLNKDNHFGGHAIVVFGYDDEKHCFYVSDRDNHDFSIRTPGGDISEDYHLVDYAEMEAARNSSYRPFPANNKFLEFDFENIHDNKKNLITSECIVSAINDSCSSMLNPPAQLLGITGIKKFEHEVLKWKNFDDDKLKIAGITNYFQINQDGGTGGGIFRKLYGEFLIEAESLYNELPLKEIGKSFIEVSKKWDLIADDMWKLGESGERHLLSKISKQIGSIYDFESSLYKQLEERI